MFRFGTYSRNLNTLHLCCVFTCFTVKTDMRNTFMTDLMGQTMTSFPVGQTRRTVARGRRSPWKPAHTLWKPWNSADWDQCVVYKTTSSWGGTPVYIHVCPLDETILFWPTSHHFRSEDSPHKDVGGSYTAPYWPSCSLQYDRHNW